jgi:hypothetical protein
LCEFPNPTCSSSVLWFCWRSSLRGFRIGFRQNGRKTSQSHIETSESPMGGICRTTYTNPVSIVRRTTLKRAPGTVHVATRRGRPAERLSPAPQETHTTASPGRKMIGRPGRRRARRGDSRELRPGPHRARRSLRARSAGRGPMPPLPGSHFEPVHRLSLGDVLPSRRWQVRGGTAHEAAGNGSPGCALDERRGAGVHDGVPRVPGLRVS